MLRYLVGVGLVGLLAAGCNGKDEQAGDTDIPAPPLVAGELLAGAAEDALHLPIGTPLSGYTARCGCLGGLSKQDDRDSQYATAFVESTGVHLRPSIKAVWITNGEGQHLIMTKADVIYSFDGLVDGVTRRLEELTGEELSGMVTHSGNHNHSSFGTFSQATAFFLGHDKFDKENETRMIEQLAQVAFRAYQNLEPAAVGMGFAKDWDPDGKVYGDRRPENDTLVMFDDVPAEEQGGKDPYLNVLRIDKADSEEPIAMVVAWGMHPYVEDDQSSMATGDATVMVERELEEAFDTPMVAMFLNTSAGDASVHGTDDGWARMETVGIYARDPILALREQTATTKGPITLETISRPVEMNHDAVHVTRNGTVDWYYPKVQTNPGWYADDEVYDDNGDIISPLDEWNTQWGAVFCGSGEFDLPVGGMNTFAPEYSYCMQVEFMTILLETFFLLSEEQVSLPLDGFRSTYTAASTLNGIPVHRADGTDVPASNVLFGFLPGEPVHLMQETWKHRAKEIGIEDTIAFGYSMHHDGYLLPAEDWLLGGYEPDISIWGPLGAEYIVESMMKYVKGSLMNDKAEPFIQKRDGIQAYPEWPLETEAPDLSPNAGTVLTNATVPEYYWVPPKFQRNLTVPAQIKRLDGMIQIGWIGGDPGVDDPRIVLEREVSEGTWAPVVTPTGREINDDLQHMALGWTPDPLFPASAEQTHYWWAIYQAVGDVRDRTSMPLGNYRLHVYGSSYIGGATTYPWPSEPYEFTSSTFEVLPADVTISPDAGGVWTSLVGPDEGYRLIDIDGYSQGDNPLRGDLTVEWNTSAGEHTDIVPAPAPQNRRTWISFPAGEDVYSVRVTDAYGNTGFYSFGS